VLTGKRWWVRETRDHPQWHRERVDIGECPPLGRKKIDPLNKPIIKHINGK